MKKNDNGIKSTIVKEALGRLGVHAYHLLQQQASLRLLSSLLNKKSYGSIHKLIIEHNEDASRGCRRRPPLWETRQVDLFKQNNPRIAAAMEKRDITPRIWCFIHSLVYDFDCADIYALNKPAAYEYDHDVPVQFYLEQDFPEAFGAKPKPYRPKNIYPDLYYIHEISYPAGLTMHVLKSDELRIKVLNKSLDSALETFAKRLKNEVSYYRMSLLLKYGISEENISKALDWLPADISKTRVSTYAINQGLGHQLARKAEARANLGKLN